MSRSSSAALALVAFVLGGCATLVSGSSEEIRVRSTPPGADVVIRDQDGRDVFRGVTPATVDLEKAYGFFEAAEYTVELSKPGYARTTRTLTPEVSPWYVGGNLFTPLLGYLIIDPLTGGMWDLEPDRLHAELDRTSLGDFVADVSPPEPGAAPGDADPAPLRPASHVVTGTASAQPEQADSPALAPQVADRWAVIVGVSEHGLGADSGLDDLAYAAKDARDVRDALLDAGWKPEQVLLLVDQGATSRELRYALEGWLSQARPEDLVLVYWSGHGFVDPARNERVYFACHDTEARRPATGYRMDHVRDAIEEHGARNVVMLADTCHAGKLVTRDGERDLGNLMVDQIEATPAPGWVFMVASAADRNAVEHASWSNGAFSHLLVRGLRGEADGFQSAGQVDGMITLGELKEFLRTAMPRETLRVLGAAKHPLVITTSGNPQIWDLPLTLGSPAPRETASAP